jgi:trigger factor
MKTYKSYLCLFAAIILLVGLMVGCTQKSDKSDTSTFSYSDGIDDNGFWKGITASNDVEMFDYKALPISSDVSKVSDEALQSKIDEILTNYSTTEEIKKGTIKDGDTVNIDYVGSVDGVEFEGGSTGGAGSDVTAGSTEFIDDFLTQIIGHKPGDKFDVNVTFPEEYSQNPDLSGKDAVFKTTINYIAKKVNPKLTDAFVKKNLSEEYGWKTVKEMKAGCTDELKNAAIQSYVRSYMTSDVKVKEVPESITEYQNNNMLKYYEDTAKSSDTTLEEYIKTNFNISSVEELIEQNAAGIEQAAKYSLVVQAVAEDAKISVNDEDVTNYFKEQIGTDDYSPYETEYGMPYLKQQTLGYKVLTYITDHAVLEK